MKSLRFALPLLAAVFSAPSLANGNSGFGLGVAYDLGVGVTGQFRGTSVFVNSDALAVDVRIENFSNDLGTAHAYIDVGGFYEDGGNYDYNDRAGVRLPVGLTFGIAPSLQAYIQAVPNFAFSDNESKEGFGVDGALGVRLRF
ncbi:hypothetical protein [Microbulbifer hydrolyticus]|uniref:Outer membrane beta-barrel protein n=1 Tax=Microbulbifer hydrolyticus TaxID=48074 RepID=A0A6P1TBM0_9GAMM|nr:hypothetical protein [Microbulbifer hydrolyticus]MBB5210484.1 hypothetical protein [Microbulbifer hydrolyticus]QHQ39036.1 hypothetical protein GTQ55_08600 [Microbulbifer hydrolyticus]